MAEGIANEGMSLEQLEKEITCAICQENYTEPKVLSCLHYYCKECILKLALRTASDEPFFCPECRQETTLPKGGVEKLKTAFFVNRFQSHLSVLKKAYGKMEMKCEECKCVENIANAFCRQCAVFICKECARQHKRMKSFASHQVVSIEDLKQGTASEMTAKDTPTKNCLTHKEPLAIYCFDCSFLICRDCTVTAHRDHKFEFSKVAAPDAKEKLLKHLSPLKTEAVTLLGAVTNIQNTMQAVEAQGNSVASTIYISFNQLQLLLDKHKQQLLQQAKYEVRKKIHKLSVQEKNLSIAAAEVKSIIDYTDRFIGHCSDNEMMSLHADIWMRVEQKKQEYCSKPRKLEPVEEADMGVEVKCSEALQQVCLTKAQIIQLALDPAQCTVKGKGTQRAEINQTAEVVLTTRLVNGETTRHKAEVVCKLKSLLDKSVTEGQVHQAKLGEYTIRYTPTARGHHELHVLVNEQQVRGSPFPMFISISPEKLGKPVKVWTEIKSPIGVAVNSVGDILVVEDIRDLVKLQHEENAVRAKYLKQKLTHIYCVATDSEDHIYCADFSSNKILRCDKYGEAVQVYEVQQVRGPGYLGVTAVRDEVMVCECFNRGTILVYDQEFKYVRQIEQDGMGQFYNISADSLGNLYVTDIAKHYIRVFSNDGVLLRSFRCDDDGVNKLNSPCGVCVSGHFVYVTNKHGHSVSVFTTAGEYVTSFGQYGDKEGDFKTPYGISVDKNNYIYVADYNNNRVQCF